MGKKIVHFEIPVSDVEKMSKFYSDLFDWKVSKQDMPGMDYWMIETTGQGPEHLAGGMYVKSGETDKPRFYVEVDEIDSHTDRFKQAGGTILVEKQEVPGYGYSVLGTDPEGNVVGLFQTTRPVGESEGSRRRGSRSSRRGKKSSGGSRRGGRGGKKGRRK
jgi:uncharacterized protein